MTEWQPIETAPKDGTLVFLWPNNAVARWDFGDERWTYGAINIVPTKEGPVISDKETDFFYCLYLEVIPTHWHPLPEPPQ